MHKYDLTYGYSLLSEVSLEGEDENIIGLIINLRIVPVIDGESLHFESKRPSESPESEFSVGGEHFFPCDLLIVSCDMKRGIAIDKRKNLPKELDIIYDVVGYEKIIEEADGKIAKIIEIDTGEFFDILNHNRSAFAIKENNPASCTSYKAIAAL